MRSSVPGLKHTHTHTYKTHEKLQRERERVREQAGEWPGLSWGILFEGGAIG